MQEDVNPQVLTQLYSEYLSRTIQLTEENAKLRVRVAELEAQTDAADDDS